MFLREHQSAFLRKIRTSIPPKLGTSLSQLLLGTVIFFTAFTAEIKSEPSIRYENGRVTLKEFFQSGSAYAWKISHDLETWRRMGAYREGNDQMTQVVFESSRRHAFFALDQVSLFSELEVEAPLAQYLEATLIPESNDGWVRLTLTDRRTFTGEGLFGGTLLKFEGNWSLNRKLDNPNTLLGHINFEFFHQDSASVYGSPREVSDALDVTLPESQLFMIEYTSADDATVVTQTAFTNNTIKLFEQVPESLDQEPIYLIIAMGQSNMVATSAPRLTEYSRLLDSEILINLSAGSKTDATGAAIHESGPETNGEWDFSDQLLSAYGPERSFARSIAAEGNKTALAKWARNGSSIGYWNPTSVGTNYYSAWTQWLDERLTELDRMGYAIKPIFFWSQGAADARWSRGSQYQNHLDPSTTAVYAGCDWPNLHGAKPSRDKFFV
jgi:hypothetical protein